MPKDDPEKEKPKAEDEEVEDDEEVEEPKKEKPKKKSVTKPKDDEDDILGEILEEYRSKVPSTVADAVKGLTTNKQIKVLKGIIKAQDDERAKAQKDAEKESKDKPIEKEKKKIKPEQPPQSNPETDDDVIKPISKRFTNREEWLDNFMNTDKLYYKGSFKKLG